MVACLCVLYVARWAELLARPVVLAVEVDGKLHLAFPMFDTTEDIAHMYLLLVLLQPGISGTLVVRPVLTVILLH